MADKGGEIVFRIPNPKIYQEPDRVKFAELYRWSVLYLDTDR